MGDLLEVTPRTLENWKKSEPGRAGRPRRSEGQRRRDRERVRAVWEADHRAGAERLFHELGEAVPLRAVREQVKALKSERREELRRRVEARRVNVEVRVRNGIWCQDATHLGRMEGDGVEGQVIRDPGPMRVRGMSVGGAAEGREVIALLEATAREQKGLPLVWMTDNGACYVSEEVEAWLGAHRVVHLRNLPRTPQHNPWAERGMRELKEVTGLGKEVELTGLEEAVGLLERAWETLDEKLLRKRLGWKTPSAADAELPGWKAVVSRETFYQASCKAVQCAVKGMRNARERRMAEREAILQTLENFGLIKRSRGGAPCPAVKPERVS